MTAEFWAIIGVGVALGGLILNGQRGLIGRMDRLELGQGELRERMVHLEGLLEGLREAITRNRVA